MDIVLIAALTVIASFAGTLSGFGTSTIMIPVLVMALPPVEAIFLVSIIHWFGNVWKVLLFRTGLDARIVALFGVPGVLASLAGAFLTFDIDPQDMVRVLGGALSAYALFLLVDKGFRIRPLARNAVLGGALSGFFAGFLGFGGVLRGMFLSAFDLPKATYIATAGAIGLYVDSARIIAYVTGGARMDPRFWWGLLAFLPLSFASAHLAKRLVDRIPQEAFRKVLAAAFFLIGLKLVVFP